MAFAARFDSTCNRCKQPIKRGQYIGWVRKTTDASLRGAYHLDCAEPNAIPVSSELAEPIEHFLEHKQPEQTEKPLPNTLESSQTPEVKQASAPSSNLMESFAGALLPFIETKISAKLDESAVRAIVQTSIQDAIDGILAQRIVVAPYEKPEVTIENPHAAFAKLLYLISKRHPVLLVDAHDGGPGSGKTTACLQAVKAVGAERFGFISLNPQTPNSAIQGFIDAQGIFRSTTFRECYEKGGVFIFDEIDHAGGMVMTSMNAAIENGHAAFPDGMIAKHADFILLATANTPGYGANYLHPERRPIDGATRDRFTYLPISYDEKMERKIALSINPEARTWVSWVQSARKFCVTNKIKCMITPRASYRGADYLRDGVLSLSEIADALVFRMLDDAIKTQILASVPLV